MKNPFENFLNKKNERQEKEKSAKPDFEELLTVLSIEEQEQLKSLREVIESAAIVEDSEGNFEIDGEQISEEQSRAFKDYQSLVKKAKTNLENNK